MARMSLPPGFRFHPTDVELVSYYLKRKLMGKKFSFEAISELNIYKFSPCDLPDKSCLRTKDLEWFFFCPREKKYASGARTNRATESGYWKTTGKDRPVIHKEKNVGLIKTLVFHSGHAPRGERTDWVMHEYRIVDTDLDDAGVPKDAYVLCKVFQKSGPGPKIGAQYGAPFNEEEWDEDMAESLAVDGLPTVATVMLNNNHNSSSELTSMIVPYSEHKCSLTEPPGPSTITEPASNEVLPDDDDVASLLAMFTDETMLPVRNDNNKELNYINPNQVMAAVPYGNDIYSGLGDLGDCTYLNEGGNLTNNLEADYALNPLRNDASFLELSDLETPLQFPTQARLEELPTHMFSPPLSNGGAHFSIPVYAGNLLGLETPLQFPAQARLEELPTQMFSPPLNNGGAHSGIPVYAGNLLGPVPPHSPMNEHSALLERSFWQGNNVNVSQQDYGIAAIANQGYSSASYYLNPAFNRHHGM